ncbi:MAG: four helix bundle protein [Bacteroidota bacterium]
MKTQLQRVVVSIKSNIAEGFERESKKSFVSFLNYVYRSKTEVNSLLFIEIDIDYISNQQFNELTKTQKMEKIKKVIDGFTKYLKKLDYQRSNE